MAEVTSALDQRMHSPEALGKYMFVRFVRSSPSGKTSVFEVDDRHGGRLGYICWYPSWRRYCFYPSMEYTVFSADCLRDIAAFIASLRSPTPKTANGTDAARSNSPEAKA